VREYLKPVVALGALAAAAFIEPSTAAARPGSGPTVDVSDYGDVIPNNNWIRTVDKTNKVLCYGLSYEKKMTTLKCFPLDTNAATGDVRHEPIKNDTLDSKVQIYKITDGKYNVTCYTQSVNKGQASMDCVPTPQTGK